MRKVRILVDSTRYLNMSRGIYTYNIPSHVNDDFLSSDRPTNGTTHTLLKVKEYCDNRRT